MEGCISPKIQENINPDSLDLTETRERKILFTDKSPLPACDHSTYGIEDALDIVQRSIEDMDSHSPPAHVIRAGVGSGKTFKTIRHAAALVQSRRIGQPVLHFVPDHKIGEETRKMYKGFGVEAVCIKGRAASGCARSQYVTDLYNAGISTKSVCSTADLDDPSVEGKCPHYAACEYILSRMDLRQETSAPVFIAPIEYLRSGGLPEEINPALVIIDEGFFSRLVTTLIVKMHNLGQVLHDDIYSEDDRLLLDRLSKDVIAHIAAQNPIKTFISESDDTHLRHSDITRVISLRQSERLALFKMGKTALSDLAYLKQEIEFWSLLSQTHTPKKNSRTCLAQFHAIYTSGRQNIEISARYNLNFTCPIVVLDASADEGIYRHILEDTHQVVFHDIANKSDDLRRVSVIGQGFSSSSLIYDGHTSYQSGTQIRQPRLETEKRRQTLSLILQRIAKKEAGRRVLICATKRVLDLFQSHELAKDTIDALNPSFINFGSVKGSNAYDDFETVIIIGKLEYPESEMTLISRAFQSHEDALQTCAERMQKTGVKRKLRTRDGRYTILNSFTYKNDVSARLHKYFRDEEIYQVEGRLRAVNRRGEDLRSYIISDAIPDYMIFNDIYAVEDLSHQGRIGMLAEQNNATVSTASYMQTHNASKQAANEALKNRGFLKGNAPEGWIAFKAKVLGRKGPPAFIYAKEQANFQDCWDNAYRHFAQMQNLSRGEVLVEPVHK